MDLPVVEIMEQFVQRLPFLESHFTRNKLVVSLIKFSAEASKHTSNSQIKFVMAIKRSGIENN